MRIFFIFILVVLAALVVAFLSGCGNTVGGDVKTPTLVVSGEELSSKEYDAKKIEVKAEYEKLVVFEDTKTTPEKTLADLLEIMSIELKKGKVLKNVETFDDLVKQLL
jgi:predicted small secreted protein